MFSNTPDSMLVSHSLDKQHGHMQEKIDDLEIMVKEQQDEMC